MTSKLLLLLGPTGVGKTTVLVALKKKDERFVYASPFITRPLRQGETDKIAVSEAKLEELWREGQLLAVNELYGVRYGTPRGVIERALSSELFPVLDWPISRLSVMESAFPNRLFRVYIEPRSPQELEDRLTARGDDRSAQRLAAALDELRALSAGDYDTLIDYRVVNETGRTQETANSIYQNYLNAVFDDV